MIGNFLPRQRENDTLTTDLAKLSPRDSLTEHSSF